MTGAQSILRWWNEPREASEGLEWRIGPLSLYIHRLEDEWQIVHSEPASRTDAVDWSVAFAASAPSGPAEPARFASGTGDSHVFLRPRTADRSLVARPHVPLHVLAGEESSFYISAPVWVEIVAGESARPLCNLPTKRLSDTWFGMSTRDGEVAYALRTQARSLLEDMPRAAYRALTPVRIRNLGIDSLSLGRMNLPAPYLSIYACDQGQLWTEAVTLVRGEDDQMALFEPASGPPAEARGARIVGEPRQIAAGHSLVRAFGRLLSPFQDED